MLTGSGHEGAVYELAGESFTMHDLAAVVSEQLGREVRYTDLPPGEYGAALTAAGVPSAYAELLVDADMNIANGWLDAPATTLAALIGRPTTPLAVAVRVALTPVG